MFQSVLEVQSEAEHKYTLIFLGGVGDVGENFEEKLKKILPNKNTKLVLPAAMEMYVKLYNKVVPSWWDCQPGYEGGKGGPERIDTFIDVQAVRKSHSAIMQLIDKEALQVPRNKIVVGGFSMGGALALYTGLNSRGLGGVFSIAGYIPDQKNISFSTDFPVLLMQGEGDAIIPIQFAQHACKVLKLKNVEHELKKFQISRHILSDEMYAEVGKFLRRCI